MKKLLIAGLLLAGTTAFGASGYVSSEYESYNYNDTDNNFQRVESFIGLNDVLDGTLELRHRDTYNGSNNFRMRYTRSITEQFSTRYQYYSAANYKAEHRIQLRYEPTILNGPEGLSTTLVADLNKVEGGSAYAGAQVWVYYTVPQTLIPKLTLNNESYVTDIDNIKEKEDSSGVITFENWINATVYETEYNGFKLSIVGRVYDNIDYKVAKDQLEHSYGARAYAFINKDFKVSNEIVTGTLEYRLDYNFKNEEAYQYVAAKATYRF